jgi:hypothetical protein
MCVPATSIDLHDRFLTLLPKIETHGHIFFRHLKPHWREEVLQEMRALAWKWFVRLTERGKDATDFISTFSGLLARALKSGRKLTGQERAKDAMCHRTQRRRGFKVEPLPSTRASYDSLYSDVHGQQEHDAFEERLRDNTVTPVPDQVAFRIDWPAWLQTRGHRDRRIIHALIRGQRALDISRKLGLSPARMSQLRRGFQQDWERFVDDHAEQDVAA